MKVHTRRRRAGFSLTELLVVLGIMAVLMAVAVPSVIHYRRELKLTELDDNARAVFVAAQNHLTALRSTSVGEMEIDTATEKVGRPAKEGIKVDETQFMYVSTDVVGAEPGWLVLPGSIESDLAEGSYLVEFDPASGGVYGVFFMEKTGSQALSEGTYNTIRDANCRNRAGRKAFLNAEGIYLGYYGADGAWNVTRPDTQELPKPKLELINAEELVLKITPDKGITSPKIYASVSVSNRDGTKAKTLIEEGRLQGPVSMVLDTLDPTGYNQNKTQSTWNEVGGSFAQWMTDTSGGYVITPGEDITVTVSIWYKPDPGEGMVALPQTASVSGNSLFAARNGETVHIAYGRHLQNLNQNTSYLDSTITAAKQTREIDFGKAGDRPYSWVATYPGRTFSAIGNANLDSYNGQGRTIRNLNTTTYPYAGLFGSFGGSTLENIVMVDTRANGGMTGALVGVANNTTVDNCQVYLSAPGSAAVRIQGGTAGSLIGQANNVTIQNGSFASTVVSTGDAGTVGGLVGRANGLTVKNSYAAGHLSGGQVGGLVGGLSYNNSRVTIQNSYAAGTIAKAVNAAGGLLVPHEGTVAESNNITVQNSYAVVDYVSVPTSDKVYGAVPVGSCANVSYLVKAGVNDAVAVPNVTPIKDTSKMQTSADLGLGAQFDDGADAATIVRPYNLPNQTDGTREPQLVAPYPYPTISVTRSGRTVAIPHYGDWLVAEAGGSLLAYYEQFLSDAGKITEYSCFQGSVEKGDLDLTRTGAINADGYAFLSMEKLNEDWEGKTDLTVKAVGMQTKETTVRGRFLNTLDKDLKKTDVAAEVAYYAYAIPTAALDVIPTSGCYNEVTVRGKAPQVQWNVPPTEVEASAWINPLFARAAYNGAKPASAPKPIHIRSLRQLANVGRFFGARDYVQDLDIDASIYYGDLAFDKNGNSLSQEGMAVNEDGHVTVAGFEVWGRGWDKNWDYATNIWSMPTEYRLLFAPIGQHDSPDGVEGGYDKVTSFNGVYDGNGRTIQALSIRSYYYEEDKADYTGLFYRVIGGTLKDIHLSDCDVIGAAGGSSNATGALVGRLSSGSKAINCTVKDCAIMAPGTKAGGHIGGLIGYADNGSLVVNGCTVENSMVDGGEYSHNAGGLVGYIYKLTPDKSTGSGGVFQNCTVKDVETKIGFTGKDSVTNVSKLGTAAGFVGCLQDSTGLLERCTVIGTGGFGVSGSTRSTGGFVGIISNKAGVSVQDCGVRLEKPGKSGYSTQGVSGGRVSGGFVGTLIGGSVTESYSAVKVDGATAGGFVGSLEGGSISNSYAAGHTQSGKYSTGRPNVTGTDFAGGLIGLWKSGSLDTCYTTCAVSGTKELTTDVFANQDTAVMSSPTPNCYGLGTAFVGGANRGSLTKTSVAVKMPKLDPAARTETHSYDTALTEGYPYQPAKYADGAPVPHYGDWPDTVSSRPGFEWTPEPEEFGDPPKRPLDASADWNGNGLTLTFITKGDGSNLANVFAPSGGHFAITTDLGYVMVFKAESNGDGSTTVYGPGGEKICDIVPEEQGYGDDRLRTYEITIPTADLPPYLETINLGGFKEGYIISDIKNRDPSASDYKPDTPFLPGDEVQIDGDFSDWDGYPHQLLVYTPGNALTDGNAEGAAFGDGNVIYLHVRNHYKSCLVAPNFSGNLDKVPPTNMSISVKGYDGWGNHDFQWWRFTGQAYTGPGFYKLEAARWNQETSQSENVLEMECYLTIGEDGSQEIEMVIYLDEMVGKENADKITSFTVTYPAIGGSLTIYRDPPESGS